MAEENHLTSFSKIIEEQSRERQEQDDRVLAEAESLLPEKIAAVGEMADEELVETALQMNSRSFADPRLTKLTQEYAVALKEEVLERLHRLRDLLD